MLDRLRASTATPDPISPVSQADRDAFHRILGGRQLSAVFQPLLDFRAGVYMGFEGLIRGPVGTRLHSPVALLNLARACDMTMEFERLCREIVFREFRRLALPGKLFVNVSISCLGDPFFLSRETRKILDEIGLHPCQIVIELTENQHVSDFSALRDVLNAYRVAGYRIAVDDLGEGFSNLRIWSEVHPEYVKIDRHFISGIADDTMKFHMVKAIRDLGEASQAKLIAEGIETQAEFETIRDLGIDFGQGFLIARPAADPGRVPDEQTRMLIKEHGPITFPFVQSPIGNTLRNLCEPIRPVVPETHNDEVYDRFEADPELMVIPVVEAAGKPLGLINRYSVTDRFARPFQREVYGRKACTLLMDTPLIVDIETTIQEASRILAQAERQHMLDGFMVIENGVYAGLVSAQVVVARITDLQIHAARYANPLTQLPGNVPINEHIDRLLESNSSFVACYCDLDHFKPYNDSYGYRKGDEVIQFLGSVLAQVCDVRRDFVGHVGGDDFVMLLQSESWHEVVDEAMRRFSAGIPAFLDGVHIGQGGYWGEDRRGQPVFHPLPALSIGCVVVEVGEYHSHHEISAAMSAAKKQAKKKTSGNGVFVERRRANGGATIAEELRH
jgi:EAL domain-containing protein (putative c-di-GMP-specific phosphodiesterase class I)/GGDEF domain-containing protein